MMKNIKVRLISEIDNRDKYGNVTESNIRFSIDDEEHQFNIYNNIDVDIGQQLVFELERILNQHQIRLETNLKKKEFKK